MLISFEGIDNCGKTTHLELLENYLTSSGLEVLCVRDPGGTVVSEQIRNILLDSESEISNITELLLFESARAELVNKIILPAINRNVIVLSDRFVDSTVAYQGYGRGLNLDVIKTLNQIASNNLLPAATFYLKIDLATSIERRPQYLDRIEQIGSKFIQKTIEGFDAIANAEHNRIITIDATQNKEIVANKIVETLKNGVLKNILS